MPIFCLSLHYDGFKNNSGAFPHVSPSAAMCPSPLHFPCMPPGSGLGVYSSSYIAIPLSTSIPLPYPVTQIAAGWASTCFLFNTGSFSCVGYNIDGQVRALLFALSVMDLFMF